MKSIMVVDDEFLVRIGIKSMLDWEANGYTIVCEAVNGQDAMEKITQFSPQIVLTDLVMEPVNGLELIEYCAKTYTDIKFIVLSNYNDFEKVKAAMKLGARDFLFKLTVKPEELLNIINAVSKEIDNQKLPEASIEFLINRNMSAIRQRFIRIIIENKHISHEEIINELNLIEIKTDFQKPYVVLYFNVANFAIFQSANIISESNLFTKSLENAVSDIITERFKTQTFTYESGDCIVMVNIPENTSLHEFYNMINDEYTHIVIGVYRYFGVTINGVVSDVFSGISSFSQSVASCRNAITERFNRRENLLILCSEMSGLKHNMTMPDGFDLSVMQEYLEHYCFEEAEAFVKEVMNYFYSIRGADPHLIREKLYSLYQIFKRDAALKGIHIDEIVDSYKLPIYQAIFRYDLLSSIEDNFLKVLGCYATECRKISDKKPRKEIQRIIGYIRDHLSDELDVVTAARMAHMNESYFSHVFKMELGISFVNYINHLRIEKAEELLARTDMKVNEIAYAVGIDNPNYFSVLFKKMVGKSPNEYRNG